MITGPWADWDRPLLGQEVYFSREEYPDRKKATEELRTLISETGQEDDTTPGPAKKKTVKVCSKACEEYCEYPEHLVEQEVWVYTPRAKVVHVPGPPVIMRCPSCRLLCVTSGRSLKTYIHGAWNSKSGKVDRCPGSRLPALDPATTKPH